MKVSLKRRGKGFTLVELLVVVMIIAILATVGLPQYFRTVERSRMSEATNLCASLNTAQQRFFMLRSSFTGNLTDLDISMPTLQSFATPSLGSPSGSGTGAAYTINIGRTGVGGGPGVNISYTIRCFGNGNGGAGITCPSCPGYLQPN